MGSTGAFSDSFCEGQMYELPDGRMVNMPDTYEVTLSGQSANGCDSIVTITLAQNQGYDFGETIIVCDANTYDWNGQTYNADGVYSAAFQSINGCDSLRTLNLTFDGFSIHGPANAGADAEECQTETELFGLDVSGTIGIWTSPTGATINPTDQGAAIASGLQSGENVFVWSISTDDCADFSRDTTIVTVNDGNLELAPDFGVFRNTEPIQIGILSNDNLNGVNQFTVTCFDLPQEISSCNFDAATGALNIEIDNRTVGVLDFSYSICADACPELCDTTQVQLEVTSESTQVDYIITPGNSDGLNDALIFDNLNLFPDNELVIYNRWGSIVYRAQPYRNDWDGTHNGSRLPEADYYYVFRKELPGEIEYGLVSIKY